LIATRVLIVLLTILPLSACTAEGNSFFIGTGETSTFINMSACEKEAVSTYKDGGSRYSGFECRELFLGTFLINSSTFYDGQRQTIE